MPIDPNELAMNSQQTQSTFAPDDFASRIIPNTGNRNPSQALAQYKQVNSTVFRYQFPSDIGKYYMAIDISNYERESATKLAFTTTDTVILPMPNQLADADSVKYYEGQLGQLWGTLANEVLAQKEAISDAISNSKSAADSISKLNGIVNNANKDGNLAAAVVMEGLGKAGQVVEQTTGLPIKELVGLAGFSPNEFFVVLLSGPSYKEYVFSWRLMPRNAQESLMIKRICNKFQNAKAVGQTPNKLFWTFPQIFRLSFYPNTRYLYKFKPAVLEDITINYAPNGSAAFFVGNGAPEAIELTCRFKEMEYWIESDYIDSDSATETQGPRIGDHKTPNEQ